MPMKIQFSGCVKCRLPAHVAQGSKSEHPSGALAIVTCFHGPVHAAKRCICGASSLSADGEPASVLEEVESRDVAWLVRGTEPAAPRPTPMPGHRPRALTRPLVGERVSVELPSGTVTATIIGVTGRDHDADPQQEILLDRGFACGDSGSAVLNVDGEIVAVVRNTGGRCGFVNG